MPEIHQFSFFTIVSLYLLVAAVIFVQKTHFLGAILNLFTSVCALLLLFPFLFDYIQHPHSQMHSIFSIAFSMPLGTWIMRLDMLSLCWVVVLFLLSAIFSLYSMKQNVMTEGKLSTLTGRFWGYYSLLILSMFWLLASAQLICFLVAWETMTLCAFALLMVRVPGKLYPKSPWLFLIFSQLSFFALLAGFLLIYSQPTAIADFEFSYLESLIKNAPGALQNVIFFLLTLGFGVKMAIFPFYGWLPRTYSESATPVTCLLSGVMINLAVYGLFRFYEPFFLSPDASWGLVMVIFGALSVFFGAFCSLVQNKLKKLLAYSSVENMGIVFLAFGLGLSAAYAGETYICVVAMSAAFLHAFNHALIKPFMFLVVDVAARAIGTQKINEGGGLIRFGRGVAYGVGSMALSGLPPFACFASILLLFMAAFEVFTLDMVSKSLLLSATLCTLSLSIGAGLSLGAYTKSFGLYFLGHFRGEDLSKFRHPDSCMRMATTIYIYLLIFLCLFQPVSCFILPSILTKTLGLGITTINRILFDAPFTLLFITSLFGISCIIVLFCRRVYRHYFPASVGRLYAPTWMCGYLYGHSKMQYSNSSFSANVTEITHDMLPSHQMPISKETIFPEKVDFSVVEDTRFDRRAKHLAFRLLYHIEHIVYLLENGSTQLFVFFILLTLIILLTLQYLFK